MSVDSSLDLISLFPDAPDLVAHYARRSGGVSESPFDSLNLGFSTGDDPGAVVENRRRLASALSIDLRRFIVPGQVHGAEVLVAQPSDVGEGAEAPSSLPPHDAVLLSESGTFALSLSADCPLVAIMDPIGRRAGVAHAGWKGTAAGVILALVDALRAEGSETQHLRAAVSPGIGGGCYEVGEEVFAALSVQPGADAAQDGRQLDLRTIHEATLRAAGVFEVFRVAACSACEPESYFSYRRDQGKTGRNGLVIGWR